MDREVFLGFGFLVKSWSVCVCVPFLGFLKQLYALEAQPLWLNFRCPCLEKSLETTMDRGFLFFGLVLVRIGRKHSE